MRASYEPKDWAIFSGTFNDLERKNGAFLVNHRDHSRSASVGASVLPNDRYGFEIRYGYSDDFSRTTICYAGPALAGAGVAPADCGTNTNLGDGHYDAPSDYALAGMTVSPVKTVHARFGYRVNAVSGMTEMLDARAVPGALHRRRTPMARRMPGHPPTGR